ncbi:MAG: hypothetical protein AAF334_09445, partial [Pseudomonadota bacterium]
QAAQALADENWAETERAYADRQTKIEDNEGLYYLRVRETPLSRPLPDPLPLRPERSGDLVPGCTPQDGVDLSEEMEPFIDALMELPMYDWAALHGRSRQLPSRRKLDRVYNRRRNRFAGRTLVRPTDGSFNYAAVRLAALNQQLAAAIEALSSLSAVEAPSIAAYQDQSARVVSINDLISGPAGRLRDDAAVLREHLEQAVICLQARIGAIPAGIRLVWAEAAEADELDVTAPEGWPALELGGAGSLNDLRTLFELVDWWFARLHKSAGGEAQFTMRATIRAILMLAAGEDPQDLLHGSVAAPQGELTPGAGLRLALNREAAPGAILQLVDPSSTVVGTLRVEDQDDAGTIAVVVGVAQGIFPDTRYTVIGHRGGRY